MHDIFNLRDTEFAICIILAIVKKSDGLNPHLNIGSVWSMVVNATFNNISVISWRLVLLVEETGVPGENNRPVVSH
jgi:hypothetical protein